jgi:hypothetical protein
MEVTPEDCVTGYLYGDELMEPMPSIYVWQWSFAIAQIIAFPAVVGFVVASVWKVAPFGFKVWWGWLGGK